VCGQQPNARPAASDRSYVHSSHAGPHHTHPLGQSFASTTQLLLCIMPKKVVKLMTLLSLQKKKEN
jgi:hypothetical protein